MSQHYEIFQIKFHISFCKKWNVNFYNTTVLAREPWEGTVAAGAEAAGGGAEPGRGRATSSGIFLERGCWEGLLARFWKEIPEAWLCLDGGWI